MFLSPIRALCFSMILQKLEMLSIAIGDGRCRCTPVKSMRGHRRYVVMCDARGTHAQKQSGKDK